MKTFIFLFLLVGGFFGYLFFYNQQLNGNKKSDMAKLEDIESSDNSNKYNQNIAISNQIIDDEAPTAIPEDQTFDTIKNIIKESTNRKYLSNITLNSRLSSYLYTEESKMIFKDKICSTFNISSEAYDSNFSKNKLVWDWVNLFRE